MGYRQAADAQRGLARARATGAIPDVVWLLEHPSVYTTGRHGRREDLFLSDEALAAAGAEFVAADRGGQMTWHGPGQTVGYAICDLRPGGRVRAFVETLVGAMADAAALPGRAAARRRDGPLRRRAQARQRRDPRERRHHGPRHRPQPRPRPGAVPPHDRVRRAGRRGDLDRRRGRRSRPGARGRGAGGRAGRAARAAAGAGRAGGPGTGVQRASAGPLGRAKI